MPDRDDPDRAAIVARRSRFIARALDGLRGTPTQTARRRTKAIVLGVSSLTMACPCLKMAEPPPPEAGKDEPTKESETGSATSATAADDAPAEGTKG